MSENIIAAREVMGNYLSGIRESKGITKYRVAKSMGLTFEVINAIEEGSKSYTIDSLLKYASGVGVYLFFGDKAGKDGSLLDEQHMMDKMEKNDPNK